MKHIFSLDRLCSKLFDQLILIIQESLEKCEGKQNIILNKFASRNSQSIFGRMLQFHFSGSSVFSWMQNVLIIVHSLVMNWIPFKVFKLPNWSTKLIVLNLAKIFRCYYYWSLPSQCISYRNPFTFQTVFLLKVQRTRVVFIFRSISKISKISIAASITHSLLLEDISRKILSKILLLHSPFYTTKIPYLLTENVQLVFIIYVSRVLYTMHFDIAFWLSFDWNSCIVQIHVHFF